MFTVLSVLLEFEQERAEMLVREAPRQEDENLERESGATHPGFLQAGMGGGFGLHAHTFEV